MSLPETPENRLEQYLQNIAEGSGDVPETPSNRLEQYLAYIASLKTVAQPSMKNVVFSRSRGTQPFSRRIITENIIPARSFYICAPMVVYHMSGRYDFSIYNIWLE